MNQIRGRRRQPDRTTPCRRTGTAILVAVLLGRLAVFAVTILVAVAALPAPARAHRPDPGIGGPAIADGDHGATRHGDHGVYGDSGDHGDGGAYGRYGDGGDGGATGYGGDGGATGYGDHDGVVPVRTRLAWLATTNAIFAVDAAERIVRYRGCDGDTGRLLDQGMRVIDEMASGRVTVGDVTYAYRVPLRGRAGGTVEISRPGREPELLTGEVVTNPQPPVDRERGAKLLPLTERLREIVAASPNPTGVAVRDLSGRYGDQQVGVDGTFRPKAASVIKLWILTELLREVDCGWESLDDGVLVEPKDVVGGSGQLQYETFPQVVTLYRLAQYMIIYSDNTAANVLINYLNGFVRVNALIDTMLLKQTALNRRMLDTAAAARGEENYLTADDVVSLLGAVWDGNILSPTSRALMISFMLQQTINTKIPAALPPGVPVAHKTGELPDASHDVGYLLIPHSEVAVAFVTSGPEATGAETVRQLARAVYDYLVPPPAVTGLGPAPTPR